MKIAYIGQKGIPVRTGGIERHVSELAPRLAENGWEVLVYTRPWYSKDLKEYKGVKLISLPSIRTKHLDAITHTFLATLDVLRREVDIIHYQGIGPSFLSFIPRIFKPKAVVISTFHCKDYLHQKWGWFARVFLKISEYITCSVPHGVLVSSNYAQKEVLDRYQKDALVLHNGGDFGQTEPAKEIAEKWGLEGNDYILTVSRLVKHKGIHSIIEAFKSLPELETKLVIVGEGAFTDDYEKQLKKLAENDKRIMFVGNQEGKVLQELYSNAKVFIQASESEGLSMALLEAMASGRPVIVSDIPENLEAVGSAGLTFVNRSSKDLADKISLIYNEPEKALELGHLAQIRVKENFTWDQVALDLNMIYHQVLENRDLKKFFSAIEG